MDPPTPQETLAEVLRVVNSSQIGVLASVDDAGAPQVRWMGFATLYEGLRKIYCLTGKQTRKIEQLRRHPQVAWLFHDEDYGRVATLHGQARAIDSALHVQQVWERLVQIGRPYLVSVMGDDQPPEFMVIETSVHRVELLAPRNRIFHPIVIDLPPARDEQPVSSARPDAPRPR